MPRGDDPDVDLVARMALATEIGPADLLAAPPEVFARMVDLVRERQKAEQEQKLRDRLRSKLRGR